jgi:hypothetical protein
MGSTLPTIYALRGKGEEKKRKEKDNCCPNNTREMPKNSNS